ncbi:receptor-type tyrosine-protein phosphatase F-like [Amblyraja radiata]|uniref:receptor-type tyrosine-protein phosphatase F-like n=1 Tax=Amblyraja radiata TaxID=386614 RepID=UPI0014027D91|nr:receptor-type tyrosine-protein phosphatase F-like [Amblyraja radiata]
MPIAVICGGTLRAFDRHHPAQEYISLQLPVANVTQKVAVTIGDGKTIGGFFNKPLELDWSYTLVLRVVSQQDGKKRFVCAAYKSFYISSGRMAKLVSSLLIIALLIGLLVFLAHRRWGHKLQRPREQVFTPLIRTRPGVSTEVGVSKLLDVMVKMRLFNDNSDDEDGEVDGMTMEYRNLSNYPLHSCSVGQDPHNASKSRYHTILPYDNSRVVLRDGSSCDGFINASYIDGYRKPNYYIATQGASAGGRDREQVTPDPTHC